MLPISHTMMNQQQLHRTQQISQNQARQTTQSPQKHHQTQQLLAKKRLKDSCNSCSLSKVKCNKAKPSCKRCQERGLYCYYCPSQRSGRRPASTTAATTGPPTLTPIIPRTSVATYHPHGTPSKFIPKSILEEVNPLDEFQRVTYDADFQPWGSASNPAFDNNTLDPILVSPLTAYSTTDTTGQDSVGQELSPPASIVDLDCLLNFAGHTPPTPHTPFTPQVTSYIDNSTSLGLKLISDIPHSCLNLTLNIIPMLQASGPTCALAPVPQERHKPISPPSIEHTIATNKAIIDSLSIILSCSCSLDEHLAAIISIIIFQILTSLASVARKVGHIPNQILNRSHKYAPNRPVQLDGLPLSNKILAQHIFSEIHRVATVVDVLSTRFKEARGYIDVNIVNSGIEHMEMRNYCISACVFTQLEVDLRRRVREVMSEVVEVLGEG